MSKHYRFQHSCGHIGIGPLIRTAELRTSDQPARSIGLPLSFRCPFCANIQPYLNVAAGDGVLAILEPCRTFHHPSVTLFPVSYISTPYRYPTIPSFEWRILRVCSAPEISPSDWSLAHAPGQHYRQMAWIPKPCGTLRLDGPSSSDVENSRDSNGLVRELDCSWQQNWKPGDVVKSRLPGMWSSLMANLVGVEVRSGDER